MSSSNKTKYILRERNSSKNSFVYRNSVNGRKISDKKTLNYIKALVIPPAWENVIIAYPNGNGNSNHNHNHATHSNSIVNGNRQAIGYDSKGRRQAIYSKKSIGKKFW